MRVILEICPLFSFPIVGVFKSIFSFLEFCQLEISKYCFHQIERVFDYFEKEMSIVLSFHFMMLV